MPCSGDCASWTAIVINCAFAFCAASATAGKTDAVDVDPPEPPAGGSVVSPNCASTSFGSIPNCAAAVCAIIVYIPVPRSCVPEPTNARPLAITRTTALAAPRFAGYVAVAIP